MAPTTFGMALPTVKMAQDCADYASTLEPFISQLRPLPGLIYEHITDPAALKDIYINTNPFISGLAVSLFLSPFFLFLAEVNQNWSQIDRVWSILPTLYNAHWAIWTHFSGFDTSRMDLRLVVSMIWSIRLTYNYWRRGGYKIGSEDYRWAIIKDYIGQPAFFILDVLFIAAAQNILLFLVTSPSYVSLLRSKLETIQSGVPSSSANSLSIPNFINISTANLTFTDYFFASQILYLIFQTWLADQQQWSYHQAKSTYQKTAKVPAGYTAASLDLGFNTTGLWAYSRHPNFISEQLIWWSFYLWSAILSENYFNWTIIGPIIYSLVFMGSTPITEYISRGKYPEYREYQRQVGMFLPMSWKKPVFNGVNSPAKKRITSSGNGSGDPVAARKNAEDYAMAKKRYDLR